MLWYGADLRTVLEQVTRVTKEWQLCQILLKSSQDEVCKLREEIATCHFYHQLHREELCEATRLLMAEQQLTARLRQQLTEPLRPTSPSAGKKSKSTALPGVQPVGARISCLNAYAFTLAVLSQLSW